MKAKQRAVNGTYYRTAKMQLVSGGMLGPEVKIVVFNPELLPFEECKGKYFVFSKLRANDRGGGTVRLKDRFAVGDSLEELPTSDICSDDEYY